MRRLMAAALLAIAILAPAACKRKRRTPVEDTSLLSVVDVADPGAAAQLARGFHNLENNRWRWTMSRFSVALGMPEGASRSGVRLELKGNVPDVILKRLGPISLSAAINGQRLAPQTLSVAGDFTYARDVPAGAVKGGTANVDFATDKSLAPSARDNRELALVVISIGMVPVSK